MKPYKMILISIMLITLITILYMPVSAQAAQAWTGAWRVISDASAGGLAAPRAITADDWGNLYVVSGDIIYKQASGTSTWQAISNNGLCTGIASLTVDKDGNIYVAGGSPSKVMMLPVGDTVWKTIGGFQDAQVWIPGKWELVDGYLAWLPGHWQTTPVNNGGIGTPLGIAVDDNLNIYVASQGDGSFAHYMACEKLQNGNWSTLGHHLTYIQDVALDTAGDVYVASAYDPGTNIGSDAIRKYSGGAWSPVGYNLPNSPVGVHKLAIDAWDNIYVRSDDDTIKVLNNGAWKTIGGYNVSGPSTPWDIATDKSGNLYATDNLHGKIYQLQAPATSLVWVTQPGNGVAGQSWATPPEVALVDANGFIEANDNTHYVTLTLNNANGAALSSETVRLQNGKAVFNNLTVNKVGGNYTLTPSCDLSAELAVQTSGPFSMSSPPMPVVTGISPADGAGGTRVTITGTDLTAALQVHFGSIAGVNLAVNSSTSVSVTAPAQAAGTVDVRVTTPAGQSEINASVNFTYAQPGTWVGSWSSLSSAGLFTLAADIAISNTGAIYVLDQTGKKLMQFANNNWSDVTPIALSSPKGLAISADGAVYISDDNRIIRNGSVIRDFGGTDIRGIAVDSNNNVYAGATNKVQKYNGSTWTEITGDFIRIVDIAVDKEDAIYIIDSDRADVRKSTNGGVSWTTLGNVAGNGIAVDDLGNVYVAGNSSNCVYELPVGGSQWVAIGGSFTNPRDVAIDSSGNLYTTAKAGSVNSMLFKHQPKAMQLIWKRQPANGEKGKDLSSYPMLALADSYGNTVTEANSATVTLTLANADGAALGGTKTVTLVKGEAYFVNLNIDKAGSGYQLIPSSSVSGISMTNSNSFSISEPPTPADPLVWAGGWTDIGAGGGFLYATGIAVGQDLHVYVSDTGSVNFVRQYDGGSWLDNTTGLSAPSGVAVGNDAAVYIADSYNYRVLKNGSQLGETFTGNFLPMGIGVNNNNGNVYVAGGNKAFMWNGSAWIDILYHFSFSSIKSLAVDTIGNIYVADAGANSVCMLPAGTSQWKTMAAGFNNPTGIAVDNSGNIYVANQGTGVIKVLRAGSNVWSDMPGGMWGVTGVAVDKLGYVYVAYNSYVYRHNPPAAQLTWTAQPNHAIAGQPQQIKVSLLDTQGNVMTNDNEHTVTLTLNNANGASINTATAALVNGVATFNNFEINKAGTNYSLTAAFGGISSNASNSFNINVGNVSKLLVTANSIQTAGNAFDVTVRAEDDYGNAINNYTGAVKLISSDTQAVLPADYTFLVSDNGTHTFSNVLLKTSGVQSITATDTGDNLITGDAGVLVNAGVMDTQKSTVSADITTVLADGTSYATIIVTLEDIFGNPANGRQVSLDKNGGSSVISALNSITDINGIATFMVKNSTIEKTTYAASETSSGLTVLQTVEINFTRIFDVTFDSQGGSSVAGLDGITSGSKISAPVSPTRTGYTFDGWYKEPECANPWDFDVDTLAQDTTLYAKWTPVTLQSITITIPAAKLSYYVGESLDISGMVVTGTYSDGTTKTEIITAANVTGFSSSAPAVNQVLTVTVGGKTTTYAVTINAVPVITYTVTFNKNGGDTDASPASRTAVSGGNVGALPTAPARTGYTFAGWNTAQNGGGTTFTAATAVNADMIVYAQWTLNPPTDTEKVAADKAALEIGFAAGDSTAAVTQNLSLTVTGAVYGSAITWASSNTAVISNSGVVTRPVFSNGDANVTVTASVYSNGASGTKAFGLTVLKLPQPAYTVTFKDWNGTVLKTETVNAGSSASAPANPTREGHTFTGWDKAFGSITANMTVTAQYSINSYTVSFNTNGGSAVNSQAVIYNGKAAKPADPTKSGNTFGGWYSGSGLTAPFDFVNTAITGDITLYAKWTPVTLGSYTVTFNKNGGDTDASPATKTAAAGGNVGTLPESPARAGYTFSGWNTAANGSGTAFTAATAVTADMTVYARWTLNPLSVTVTPDNAKAGDGIRIAGSTSASVPVSIRVLKADGTAVYSLDTTSGTDGTFTGTFAVPGNMTPGILYGSVTAVGRKVTANVVVYEEAKPYVPAVEITTPEVTVSSDGSNKNLELPAELTHESDPITVTVPAGVTDATIAVTQLLNAPSGGIVETQPLPALRIEAVTAVSTSPVKVEIPSGTTVSAPAASNWDGTIHVPTVKANSSVTVAPAGGDSAIVESVIEVGYGDVPITFSKAVRLLIPGQAGKKAGYVRTGTFYPITTVITADSQSVADSTLSDGEDGYIYVGSDMVLWTKHFTRFVTYSLQLTPVQLGTPTGLSWDGSTKGKAKWSAVEHAVSYSVQLKKDGSNLGSAVSVNTGTEYDFTGAITANGSGSYTFTVTAIGDGTNYSDSNVSGPSDPYTYMAGTRRGSSGGGGASGVILPAAALKTVTAAAGNIVTATITAAATVGNNGKAAAAVTWAQVSDAVGKVASEAEKQGEGTAAAVEIKVTAPAGVKIVEASIPGTAFAEIAENRKVGLEVSTPIASISFSPKALDTISQAAAGDVRITAAKADTAALPEEIKQVVGDRPVFNFSVTSGDRTISQFGGNVTVSVPYTPKAGEDTNAIVIYYINAEGRLEIVSNGSYNPVTGTVSFATNHFSQYAVGYNKVSFRDVAEDAWYSGAVGFIAARDITTGTGNGNYSPEAKLSRGEFIVMMMRAYGIAPDANPKDNFADSGNTYYTGYLAAAKRLGISAGVGNNMYAPGKEITRQEMFTLLHNALKVIGQLPQGNSGKTLSSFSDAGQIASWAKDAIALLVQTEAIGGNNGKLSPTSTATRAEMAQVLYNLLSK